jgi:hypothetical protein
MHGQQNIKSWHCSLQMGRHYEAKQWFKKDLKMHLEY